MPRRNRNACALALDADELADQLAWLATELITPDTTSWEVTPDDRS